MNRAEFYAFCFLLAVCVAIIGVKLYQIWRI